MTIAIAEEVELERRRSLAGYLVTPAVLLAVLVVLALYVSSHHLAGAGERKLSEVGLPIAVVTRHATLSDTLNEMLTARYSTAVVVDDSGAYAGVVEMDTINEAIRSMRTGERRAARDRLEAASDTAEQPDPAP